MSENTKYFKGVHDLLVKDENEFLSYLISNNNYDSYQKSVILKAYDLAFKAHSGQKRKSGEPFVYHPLNVAKILMLFSFDYETVTAGILHDVVEDTDVSLDEIKILFGSTIVTLVDGVTKMKDANFSSKEESLIATHKKILESVLVDARIIAVKLADRLHNMITMDSMKEVKQKQKSLENMEFGVPLARTLGMYMIKDELQDLSLYYLYKEEYEFFYEEREKLKKKYYPVFTNFTIELGEKLEKENIRVKFSPKIKNVGGIYEEIVSGKELDDIFDLGAMRIILDDYYDYEKILYLIEMISEFIPNTYKDYITNPKYNGYKSVNQNIIYSDNNIQVRIRNKEHEVTNRMGVVANWNESSQKIVRNMCHNLIEMENKNLSNKEFMEEAKRYFLKRRGQD